MKKIKRIVALVCAMVMMMAMSTISFAADSAKVTISGLDSTVTQVQVTKVIGADTTTKTGLKITNEEFKTALKGKYGDTKTEDELINSFKAASDTDRAALLDAVTTFTTTETTTLTNGAFSVSEVGLYVIKVPSTMQTRYTYNVMAAYVGVKYLNNGSADGVVENVSVIAKGAPKQDKKSYNGTTDKTVEIGDTISYKIDTTVPYIAKDDATTTWTINDTLTGGSFSNIVKSTDDDARSGDTDRTGMMRISVKVGDANPSTYYVTVTKSTTEAFSLDLTSVAKAYNEDTKSYTNTNKAVIITYTAQATKTTIKNEEYSQVGNNPSEKSTVTSKTADITVYKNTVAKTGETFKPLAGAKFIIIKKDGDKTYYANLDLSKTLPVENAWVEYTDIKNVPESAKITTVLDGDKASATAYGFDGDQNAKYFVVETDAPTGYALPATTEQAVTNFTVSSSDEYKYTASVTFNDPELTSLPMTGGMGTTLFTVIGVAVMVLAAALYLANKKKNAAN